mmetsp:Transcript_40534/g.114651  ORF Transcript_40534/g.114651 Transcript_40534/m.114651 type:complete len:384 (-) Transcript_40534:192-1343(-)
MGKYRKETEDVEEQVRGAHRPLHTPQLGHKHAQAYCQLPQPATPPEEAQQGNRVDDRAEDQEGDDGLLQREAAQDPGRNAPRARLRRVILPADARQRAGHRPGVHRVAHHGVKRQSSGASPAHGDLASGGERGQQVVGAEQGVLRLRLDSDRATDQHLYLAVNRQDIQEGVGLLIAIFVLVAKQVVAHLPHIGLGVLQNAAKFMVPQHRCQNVFLLEYMVCPSRGYALSPAHQLQHAWRQRQLQGAGECQLHAGADKLDLEEHQAAKDEPATKVLELFGEGEILPMTVRQDRQDQQAQCMDEEPYCKADEQCQIAGHEADDPHHAREDIAHREQQHCLAEHAPRLVVAHEDVASGSSDRENIPKSATANFADIVSTMREARKA